MHFLNELLVGLKNWFTYIIKDVVIVANLMFIDNFMEKGSEIL